MSNVWDSILESIKRVEETTDIKVYQDESQFVLPNLKQAWDLSPHAAMQCLMRVAQVYPIKIAKDLVRKVVLDWQRREKYSWDEGGNAGYCFLFALLSTGNDDLAEDEFVDKWGDELLKYYHDRNRIRNRTRDFNTKFNLIRRAIDRRKSFNRKFKLAAPPPSPPPSAPPPLAAPPPYIRIKYILIGLAIFIGVLFLLTKILSGSRLLFFGQMTLFTVGICSIPTVAYILNPKHDRIFRILLETTLFIILLAAFCIWLFGINGLGVWLAYAFVIILVLEAGSNFIERYMITTLKRISRNVFFRNLQNDADAIKKMFHGELILYVSVPLGLLIGTITGLIYGWPIQKTIVFCVQPVLLLASLVLLVSLINAFIRMTNPLFKEDMVTSPRIIEEPINKKIPLFSSTGTIIKVLLPQAEISKGNQEEQDLSIAYIITDLRKIYLYDSVHNVILLFAFLATVMSLWNFNIEMKWLISGLLGLSLALNQLPYIIGQSLLQERVLDRYDGLQRAEISDKLKKVAPLFPTFDFWAALTTTGTAGGLVYFLLDQFLKNTLK